MRRLLLVTVMVAAVAIGCGGDDGDVSGAGGDEAPPDATLLEGDAVEIQAIDNSFVPEAARVVAGTEVTFVNSGHNNHNVVPEDDGAEWGLETEEFNPGESGSYTFAEPGVYKFFCSIHGTIDTGMPGVLVVE